LRQFALALMRTAATGRCGCCGVVAVVAVLAGSHGRKLETQFDRPAQPARYDPLSILRFHRGMDVRAEVGKK